LFCFFNARAPPVLYTLSLHDALPISLENAAVVGGRVVGLYLVIQNGDLAAQFCTWLEELLPAFLQLTLDAGAVVSKAGGAPEVRDRKSTRLNSSHVKISYAVFCLKKK